MKSMKSAFETLCLGAIGLLLAGCAAQDSATESPDESAEGAAEESALSAQSVAMAKTAWLSVSKDGDVFTTYLDADGRYRDLREGAITNSGTWEQNEDGELCFKPDSGLIVCWAHGRPGLNGVMRATNASGRAIEVKKVSYRPPENPGQTDQAGSDGETDGDAGETPSAADGAQNAASADRG
jgi:hypothetical protein